MAQVCFDSAAFYPVMIIGITVILFALYTVVKFDNSYQRYQQSQQSQQDYQSQMMQLIPQIPQIPQYYRDQPAEDLTRMLHPMAPPLKRDFYGTSMIYPQLNVPVNIPTRGEYGNFHQLGFLFNDAEKAMALMGRRIHSNQYEYYTFHHKNPQLKIPINNTKEINDGEALNIPGYGGSFTVKLYDNDSPRYVPY